LPTAPLPGCPPLMPARLPPRGREGGSRGGQSHAPLSPHRGSLICNLGLLSFLLPFPLGPIAWVLGTQDLAEMRSGRMDPTGEGSTRTGRTCGKIATLGLLVLFAVGMCLGLILLSSGLKLLGLR